MNKMQWALVGIAIIIGGAIVGWYSYRHVDVAPYAVVLAEGESVPSWDFTGVYTGNPDLEQKAENEIKRLNSLFGSKDSSDYELYVSISNQYQLLGDGKNQLLYLEKALTIDSAHSGLAWGNIAKLFESLGIYKSARFAYERAAEAQPTKQFLLALHDFLRQRFPSEKAEIQKAQTDYEHALY